MIRPVIHEMLKLTPEHLCLAGAVQCPVLDRTIDAGFTQTIEDRADLLFLRLPNGAYV
jgi:hypothetical protein